MIMTNKEFTKDEIFVKCCEEAGTKVTRRQASKFRNGKGVAFRKKPYVLGLKNQ
jgi:hypothetical protein